MKIKKEPGRIIGSCKFYEDGEQQPVIGFTKIMGTWTVGMSTCLPSDIKDAERVLLCYNETLRTLKQVMREETQYYEIDEVMTAKQGITIYKKSDIGKSHEELKLTLKRVRYQLADRDQEYAKMLVKEIDRRLEEELLFDKVYGPSKPVNDHKTGNMIDKESSGEIC